MVNKVALLHNFSPNGETKKKKDIKTLNFFSQNIRGLRGKANLQTTAVKHSFLQTSSKLL
jgi:hypothetical protein